ncbi:PHP domain-containing protein [Enterococcus sp. DIV0086]|uniref:PHP domain-containing protein n=1 Tax=Enterococcus sp. DIV0086 TaxID=2774655 RepID=UPI003D2E7C75
MKKLDLHIHTIRTISDSKEFNFSIETLKNYINERKIDAIAITNHNVFDYEQFKLIKDELNITVFPGVEVDLEKGHLLVIADNKTDAEIKDFAITCEGFSKYIIKQSSSLTLNQFFEVIPPIKLKNYLVIPHYIKSPEISDKTLQSLKDVCNIYAGEVSSTRKFMDLKNRPDDLTPVLFSDQRISEDLVNFSNHQTYLNISEITLSAIKLALSDKTKVALSTKEGKNLFELHQGIVASTGLNILIGERSSGKTHLLDEIYNNESNVRYIKQFELVEKDDKESEKNFNQQLSSDESIYTTDYLSEFRKIVKDLILINPKNTQKEIEKYVTSLIKNAESTEKKMLLQRQSFFQKRYLK